MTHTLVDCGCETKVHADGSGVELYLCPLHEAAPELLHEICKLPCGDCGHDLDWHLDKYGCEFDRGDGYRAGGEILEALGPCGCEGGEYDKKLIALIRKAKG